MLNKYTTWVVVMYVAMRKIKAEGLMSLECDTDEPDSSQLWKYFGLLESENRVELTFMTDVLRRMIAGELDVQDLQEYVDMYIEELCKSIEIDFNLFAVIWASLKSAVRGYHPQIGAEVARQSIPLEYKPTCFELEGILKESYLKYKNKTPEHECSLEQLVDELITKTT